MEYLVGCIFIFILLLTVIWIISLEAGLSAIQEIIKDFDNIIEDGIIVRLLVVLFAIGMLMIGLKTLSKILGVNRSGV